MEPFSLAKTVWDSVGKPLVTLGAKSRDERKERDRKRFVEIYAPLWGLFLDLHVEGARSIGAPRLRQRIANAQEVLTNRRHFPTWRTFRRAWNALFDREISESWEVIDGHFPLQAITKLLRGKEHVADGRLITLVRQANYARYEPEHYCGISTAEFALFDYIADEYYRLNKRFVG